MKIKLTTGQIKDIVNDPEKAAAAFYHPILRSCSGVAQVLLFNI